MEEKAQIKQKKQNKPWETDIIKGEENAITVMLGEISE